MEGGRWRNGVLHAFVGFAVRHHGRYAQHVRDEMAPEKRYNITVAKWFVCGGSFNGVFVEVRITIGM